MARPKKDENDKLTERHNVRFTLAEMIHIQEQAAAAGLPVAEYIRRRAAGHTVVSGQSRHTDPAVISELNRIGVNVNQLAKATHTGRDFARYWSEIGDELRGLLERLAAGQRV